MGHYSHQIICSKMMMVLALGERSNHSLVTLMGGWVGKSPKFPLLELLLGGK